MFIENNGTRPAAASNGTMNGTTNGMQPAGCPDTNGTLPSCAGLAVPSSLPATPLAELQALEFVVLELNLYLDTHKDDTEAFNLFKQFSAMEKAAKAAYESKYGPITAQGAATGDGFQWLSDPWPWNFAQNEVN